MKFRGEGARKSFKKFYTIGQNSIPKFHKSFLKIIYPKTLFKAIYLLIILFHK